MERLTKSKQLEAAPDKGLSVWLADNVYKPIANTIAVEPHNAISSSVNDLARCLGASEPLLKDWKPYDLPQAKLGSTEWLAQNVSSGVAMVVPYGVAGFATRGGLRQLGAKLELTGTKAAILKSRDTSMILGAGIYDFMRKPKQTEQEHETRLGNAAGGMAAFGVFARGNHVIKDLKGAQLVAGRVFTGAAGGFTHINVSHIISTGKAASFDQNLNAIISGGTMNVVMPKINETVSDFVTASRLKAGKPVLADDYAEYEKHRLAAAGNPTAESPTLNALLHQTPWAKFVQGQNAVARLDTNFVVADGLPKLGHELFHLGTKSSLDAARTALEQGRAVDAKNLFVRELAVQELGSRQAEHNVAREIGANRNARATDAHGAAAPEKVVAGSGGAKDAPGSDSVGSSAVKADAGSDKVAGSSAVKTEAGSDKVPGSRAASDGPQKPLEQLLREISGEDTGRGYTYGQLWEAQFEAFKASGGKTGPDLAFARGRVADAPRSARDWQLASIELPGMGEAQKLRLVENLHSAPEAQRLQLWSKLLNDPAQNVRMEASGAIGRLPSQNRLSAWKEAVAHSDAAVRSIAIGKIGELPAASRFEAWTHAFSRSNVLNRPAEWKAPSGDLANQMKQTPEAILIGQIETLPSGARETAWTRAYDNPRTRDAAIGNIAVLPEAVRGSVWHKVWNEHSSRSQFAQKNELNAIAEQVGSLPVSERAAAWGAILKGKHDIAGGAAAKALEALPVANRSTEWRKLLDAVVEREMAQPSEYKGDKGLAGAIKALPEAERAAAWNDAVKRLPDNKLPALAEQLSVIPPAQRGTAICNLMERAPQMVTANHLAQVPAEAIPAVLKTVAKTGADVGLLNKLPLAATGAMEAAQVKLLMQEIFKTASDNHLLSADLMREWWRSVPEVEAEQTGNGPRNSAIREHLAQTLPEKDLSLLLFADAAPAKLAANVELLRSLAGKFDGQASTASWLAELASGISSGDAAALGRHTRQAINSSSGLEPEVAANLFAEFAKRMNGRDNETVLQSISDFISAAGTDADTASRALEFASRLRAGQAEKFDRLILSQSENLLNSDRDLNWKLAVARQLGRLSREGYLGDAQVRIPSMRGVEIDLPSSEQARLRSVVEPNLRDPAKLEKMLGDGTLGRLFPSIFGHERDGGIVGRPQSGSHDAPNHEHSLRVVKKVLEHPEFSKLSEKDQTSLLWAALMHDTGKRAGMIDPGHELVSASLTWGVLKTLGYEPVRIQRIANLVSRHSELSYDPATAKVLSPEQIADLAVTYRHPSSALQLRILNEADISSIKAGGVLLSADALRVIKANTDAISQRQGSMALPVPLLTTEIPRGFGLHVPKGDWVVLAHASPFLESSFLKQRGTIESPSYSISTSILRPGHTELARPADIVALVNGAPESISWAGRQNLSTGNQVDWQGHVRQASTPHPHVQQIAGEVVGGGTPAAVTGRWNALWQRMSRFDSLSELAGSGDKQAIEGHQRLVASLTTDGGKTLTGHNEAKLNNATIVGLGIMRNGRTVSFEGMDASARAQLLGAENAPSWLRTTGGAVVVPKSCWQEAMKARLPFVVLD